MERNMKNNKKLFAGVLALSCAFILGACDPVAAIPAGYNDPILQYDDEGNKIVDTNDNYLGKIYDLISSNRNDKVLNKILDEIVYGKFGTYKDIVDANASDAKKVEYCDKHPSVFVKENDTNELKIARFDDFFKDVTDRISEQFYNLITSGSYNDSVTGMFDEEKLYTKLSEELYDLQAKPSTWNKFYVTAELTKENAWSYLTDGLYSYPEEQEIPGLPEGVDYKARGYIEKKIFPQIIKDKFVEDYIYVNNGSALGRSYARKVSYVKIGWSTSTLKYVDYVTNAYINQFIFTTSGDEELKFDCIDKTILGFEGINRHAGEKDGQTQKPLVALAKNSDNKYVPYTEADLISVCDGTNKGYYNSLAATPELQKEMVSVKALTNASDYTTLDGMPIFDQDFEVYPDTKLGELLDSYNKALRAKKSGFTPLATDQAELDKFTGKSLADSLRDKIIALAKEDNTTTGWYVKNGGISELPAALRDRLFNINVSNDLDVDYATAEKGGYVNETITSADENTGAYRYDRKGNKIDKMPYCRNINGRKLVMAASADDFDTNNNNFVYSDGSAYYICQVLEAPSTAKLNVENAKAYKTEGGEVDYRTIESTSRQIAKILSTKDTYVTKAYTDFLEQYSFVFYDTNLHDYFKAQYPDLFDDED